MRKEPPGPKTPKKKTTPKRISRRSSSSKDLPDIEENRLAPDLQPAPHQGDLVLSLVLAPTTFNLLGWPLAKCCSKFDVRDPKPFISCFPMGYETIWNSLKTICVKSQRQHYFNQFFHILD